MALIRVWLLALLANRAAFGQAAVARAVTPVVAATAAPTISILPAAAGALIRSLGVGNASLDLGSISYFKGTSASGETSQKNSKSFVISTRFALKVDCPGSSASAQVKVSVSRLDAAPSLGIAIDGTALGSAPQPLAQSMPCGSSGEHRLDMEVPVSTPAGSLGSNIAFVATIDR
jgi:hypothetical protein